MTDTIKISRELASDAALMLEAHSPGSGSLESYTAQDIRAALAQPSEPQGGEEVEVVGYLIEARDEIKVVRLRRLAENEFPSHMKEAREWAGRFEVTSEPLMTVAQHRRLLADHDRVVAELRSHVRTDNSAVIAGLQEQMAEARELLQAASTLFSPVCTDSTQRDWMQRIDVWLEKTK